MLTQAISKKLTTYSASDREYYDLDAISHAACGMWPTILSSLGGISIDLLDENHHFCPKCGGKDRFRMIDRGRGALLCNQCFNQKNGDGFAALSWLLNKPFKQVIADVAQYLGIKPVAKPTNKHDKNTDPAAALEFLPWDSGNTQLLRIWCGVHKQPINPEAVLAAGGRSARYRKEYKVIALPIWESKLDESSPVGWVMYNISGGKLPKSIKQSDGSYVTEWVKTKMTFGSQSGILGDLSKLKSDSIAELWKVEGVTDLLAALSLTDCPSTTTFITNSCGTKERPADWITSLFSGKIARVLHDADEPGEQGAIGWTDPRTGQLRPGWCQEIAIKATECRHVNLPYPMEKSHGKDLRDYLNEGRGFADLAEIAESSDIVLATEICRVLEAPDDPHRLAQLFLDSMRRDGKRSILRFWRGEWYFYAGTHYRKLKTFELEAELSQSIRAEFHRLNLEEQKIGEDDKPPTARKVTTVLVNNVMRALASLVIIPNVTEANSWLSGGTQRSLIAFKNGLLDLERCISDDPQYDNDTLADVLLPHSDQWFSTICLNYEFDPHAVCAKWGAMLEQNMEGDVERINLLQEWTGYLLLPDTRYQKFLALEGEGSNGKSVFLAGITALLGQENCSYVPLEQFGERFDKYSTLGKLVNISADAAELDKVSEGYLKSFTSGDLVHFDRKGIDAVEAKPTARLIMAFNNRPRFSDRSSGIWRRMLLVPWLSVIPEDDPRRVLDMDKPEFWITHNEVAGILNWAVLGLQRLRRQKTFTKSAICSDALDNYRSEANPARAFLLEHCKPCSAGGIPSKYLYRMYCQWCDESGSRALGERQFGKEIPRTFKDVERRLLGTRSGRYWQYDGIVLLENENHLEKSENDF